MLYNDYIAEKFVANTTVKDTATKETDFKTKAPVFKVDPLKKLKKVSQLHQDHPIKRYVTSRQIPPQHHYRMFFAPKFMTWINRIAAGHKSNIRFCSETPWCASSQIMRSKTSSKSYFQLADSTLSGVAIVKEGFESNIDL
jgi:hypothetical protein